MKFSEDIVIIDLEASCKTFGRNEIEESNIIEIGAVRLDKKSLEIKSEFSSLVKPVDFPILPQIADITGITMEMVAKCRFFNEVAILFLDWFGERNQSVLAGWGLYYDLPLLRKEFRIFNLDYNSHFVGGGIDIRTLAVFWLAKSNINTSGITIERTLRKMNLHPEFVLHRALDDAKATAMVFQKIAFSI